MKRIVLKEEQKELFDDLSDENAGKLIKNIFEYVVTGESLGIDNQIKIPFMVITSELDKDIFKEKELQLKRSKAGKTGMQKRWNTPEPKEVVEVATPVKRKIFMPPTLEEVENYVKEKKLSVDGKHFFEYFNEGNWIDSKGNKVRNWKQKILTWDRYSKKEKKKFEYDHSFEDLDLLYE